MWKHRTDTFAVSVFRSSLRYTALRAALMELLVKQLAIPLSNQKTVAKWLVIAIRLSQHAGKSLVIRANGKCIEP